MLAVLPAVVGGARFPFITREGGKVQLQGTGSRRRDQVVLGGEGVAEGAELEGLFISGGELESLSRKEKEPWPCSVTDCKPYSAGRQNRSVTDWKPYSAGPKWLQISLIDNYLTINWHH